MAQENVPVAIQVEKVDIAAGRGPIIMAKHHRDRELSEALARSLRSVSQEPVREVLASISAEGTYRLVAEVAILLERHELSDAVLACLDALMGRASALDFISVDAGQRRWSCRTISMWSKSRARRLLLGRGFSLRRKAQPQSLLVALAACHGNGYVRQEALEVLATRGLDRIGLAI